MEESRLRQSVRFGWAAFGQAGLRSVGRRKNGAQHRVRPKGQVQGGHGRRAAFRHARAPARKPAMSPGHTVLPDDHQRQGQHNYNP